MKKDTYFDGYGMVVVEDHELIDVDKLKSGQEYQRFLEPQRLKDIRNSMNEYGFWPQSKIVVNDDGEIIDGQHRWKAAKEVGINKIPATIVKFETKKQEAKFFKDVNGYNTKLKPVDFWHAQYLAGDVLAELIYNLEQDPQSLLNLKIALKGRQTKKSKITVGDAIVVIRLVVFDSGGGGVWKKSDHNRVCDAVSKIGYSKIRCNINCFMSWFFDAFGSEKRQNPDPYKTMPLRAICKFYQLAQKTGLNMNTVSRKMRTFQFNSQLLASSLEGITHALISHANKGKQKNRIEYS